MLAGFRMLLIGSGLLLLTLLAGLFWFVTIPLGFVALGYFVVSSQTKGRQAYAKAKAEFSQFIDEKH